MVVVPNLGGFAGVSFVNGSAKIKFGYRADFFFGAMDEGIDTRKSETLGFYGPFATISIGLDPKEQQYDGLPDISPSSSLPLSNLVLNCSTRFSSLMNGLAGELEG